MVEVGTALAGAFSIIGAFVFIVLKFMIAKMFQGWKGMIAKAVFSLVLAGLSGLVWNICPAASIILVFAVLIVGELIGFGVIYAAQYIPFVGGTISYAFTIIAPVLVIWLILAALEFLVNLIFIIVEIVLLFIPGIGWVADIIVFILSIIIPLVFPILQLFLLWGSFSEQFAGLADCIMGIGRTGPIPGTGGISIGATK